MATSLPTWVQAQAVTALGTESVSVSGPQAAPLVPSVALVVMAAGLALGLSGKVVRYVAPTLVALAAGGALIVTIGVVRAPEGSARSAAANVGGVPQIEGAATLTAWPWVSAVALVFAMLLALAIPFLARGWVPAARKYERDRKESSTDPRIRARSDWDALSNGEDPSLQEDADVQAGGRSTTPDGR